MNEPTLSPFANQHRSSGTSLLLAILLLHATVVIFQSWGKLLWGDELITLYIARTGSLEAIWHALAAGADPNPPLIHASVLAAMRLFGTGPVALRLPCLAYTAMALCAMWSILRRFVAAPFAAIGLLSFMATRGFDYSYDARSYAPMMGFSMLGLACWFGLSSAAGPRRLLLLSGMALALAAGLFSNYYCALAFLPIAAGQLVTDLRRKRLDPAVWSALFVAVSPIWLLLPLIRHNIAEFGPHAWNRPRLSVISFSYFELVEGILWPVLFVAVLAMLRRNRTLSLPAPARAALITLLLYPFLGYLVAIGGAGMISPRCVAPVCCGVGLLAGLASAQFSGLSPNLPRAALALLVLWFAARESVCAVLLSEQRRAFLDLRNQVAEQAQGQTILTGDPSLVLPLSFYSSSSVAGHLVFPVDFPRIHAEQADDSGEQNLWAGRYGIFPFPVIPFQEVASMPGGMVLARPDGWLAHALVQSGDTLRPAPSQPAWDDLGGLFSPMAHPETRLLLLARTGVSSIP